MKPVSYMSWHSKSFMLNKHGLPKKRHKADFKLYKIFIYNVNMHNVSKTILNHLYDDGVSLTFNI